jgi:hypothetical protein
MGLQGLPSQPIRVPLSGGLDQKKDLRSKEPPALDILRDMEFDLIGGLRTRYPYDALPTGTTTGGNVTDTGAVRRIVENGGELLLFTATALYTWVVQSQRWALRDTHLAVAIDEMDVFGVNGDQINVDRAELGNVILIAWTQFTSGQQYMFLAAIDKATGAVLLTPTRADTSGHATDMLRLVALNTRILLLWRDAVSDAIRGISIDPANVASSIVASTLIGGLAPIAGSLDAVQIPGTDSAMVAIGQVVTSYQLVKVTSALAVTATTKARKCDGAIALAVDPTASFIQVVRNDSSAATSVVGDLINATTMADVAINQAIGTITGTVVSHITCAYRLVQNGGQYRCYVFWSQDESGLGYSGPSTLIAFQSKSNWADTAGALGTQAVFLRDLGIASRAFAYGSSVYVWGVFAGVTPIFGGTTFPLSALQNTNLLYRDDGLLVSKGSSGRSAGFVPGRVLPGVQLVSGSTSFAWAATIRRIVPLGDGNTYSGRAPCSTTFAFDDNRARRCARLGRTLYISGGQILQYDGIRLVELGYHVVPWDQLAAASAGGLAANGNYGIKSTYKSTNGVGEVDESSSATISNVSAASGTNAFNTNIKPLYYTLKPSVNVQIYRTQVNPTDDSPFFLVSSLDPTATANPQAYLPNDSTVVSLFENDQYADTSIGNLPENPENGSILENLAPPAASILIANSDRLFIAGIAGSPHTVAYSKNRDDGHVAAFNPQLTIAIPPAGGVITGLAFLNETLVVFRKDGIYRVPGDGFTNAATGSNFGPATIVSLDCGAVSMEAIATIDDGILFKSDKGWYLLDRGWGLHYVGDKVASFDSETVLAMQVVTAQHQVRVITNQRVLILDTLVSQWGEWTIAAVDGCMWNGVHVYLAQTGEARSQRSDYTGINYGFDIECVWFAPAGRSGRCIARMIDILGEVRAPFALRVRISNNYQSDGAGGWIWNYDKTWPVTPTTVGGPLQLQVAPKRKRLEAIKVRLTSFAPDGVSAPTADTARMSGIAYDIAVEDGLYHGLPATQKR